MATQRLLGDDERDSGIDDLARPRAGWFSAVCCCCFGGGADEDGEASGGVPSPASAGGAARASAAERAAPRAPLPPSVRSGGRGAGSGDAAAAVALLPKPPGWRGPGAGAGPWPPATRSSAPFATRASGGSGVSSPPPLPAPLPRPRSFASLAGSAGSAPPAPHADDDCCPTCLEEWSADNPAVPLPACGHAFHLACVLEWSQRASSCPVCGARVDVDAVLAASPPAAEASFASAAETSAEEAASVFYDARSAVASDSDCGEDGDAVYSSATRAASHRRD